MGPRSQSAGQAGAGRVAFKVQPPLLPVTALSRPGAHRFTPPSPPQPDQTPYLRLDAGLPTSFMGEVRAARLRAGRKVQGC